MRMLAIALSCGWGLLMLMGNAFAGTETIRVETPGISAAFSPQGELTQLWLSPNDKPLKAHLATRLEGCEADGGVTSEKLAMGGYSFTRVMREKTTGSRCTVTDRLSPRDHAIHWEIEIQGEGDPWTTAIETAFVWPAKEETQFWTAWSDPAPDQFGWNDPLVSAPLSDRVFYYGAPPFDEKKPLTGYCPLNGNTFCIPIAMLAMPKHDQALSMVMSPEDEMLDLILTTRKSGELIFSRLNHRISPGHPVRFSFDLIAHPPDWRAAMAWMTARYPAYFRPVNVKAFEVAGCGAYSTYEGDLDTAKFKRMGFRVNWKASYDFPYMGMFIPPVANDAETWPRFQIEKRPDVPPVMMSIARLRDYSTRMRAMGFEVFNYFNVTEFGANIGGPETARADLPEAEYWKDANTFLYRAIPDGILPSAEDGRWGTWGGAIAMDPAGPQYQAHLLAQAQRHIEAFPDSAGICIDRMDWLRFYNPKADDGISWRNGRACRSLYTSWHGIMEKLAPIMHDNGKVIFVNNHLKRIDLLKEVDGLYCEFAQNPHALNATGLLTLQKPAIGWTADESNLKPSPDDLFQRHLHMGVFPTAPLPENDHTILPSPWVDQQYLDYGPLFDAIRGRQWVLRPDVIQAPDNNAKVNLFAVPDGFVIPVTFAAPTAQTVNVRLHDLPLPETAKRLHAAILHPGETAWTPLVDLDVSNDLSLEVPVQRGCAIVKITCE